MMTSSWGLTETSPLATAAHFPIDRAGVIGVPVPGVEIKLTPVEGKLEMRVKGPNVTHGYLGQPELNAKAFDEDGWYRTGDAGKLEDPDDPNKGLVFDGRVVEDFKLMTGHVRVGRQPADRGAGRRLAAADGRGRLRPRPRLRGAAGLAELGAAREIAGEPDAVARGARALARSWPGSCASASPRYNRANPASSTRVERVILLAEPPSLDANEITDKGYVNQRAALERRAVARRGAVRRGARGRGDHLPVGMPPTGDEVVAEEDCLDGVLGFEVVSIGDGEAVARFPIARPRAPALRAGARRRLRGAGRDARHRGDGRAASTRTASRRWGRPTTRAS